MKIVKLLFCFLFCISTFLTNAQTFGLKGGFLINNIGNKKDVNEDDFNLEGIEPDLSFGYLLGVTYRKKSTHHVTLQTELTYQQRGGKFPQIAQKTKFHYLDLSILGLINILDKTTIDFGIDNSFTKKEFIEKHDIGLIAGASQFIGKKIELSLRYYYGFKSIRTLDLLGENGDNIGSLKLYNRNVQLSVSYYFL